MSPLDWWRISLLTLVAWREARGQPEEGLRAVMHVVRNRVLKGWGNWTEVIDSHNQFSSIGTKGDLQLTLYPPESGPIFQDCLRLAQTVYAGSDSDPTNGALYYENPSTATSQWFTDNVVNKYPLLATIGAHKFYGPNA